MRDAVAVGIPDKRFGKVVAAVVELQPGASVTEDELSTHVRERLAAYKAPKRVRFVGHHRPIARRQGRLRASP